jgi:hypothetical protein
MAVIAVISLFIGTRSNWTEALTVSPTVTAAISVGYLFIVGTAALALAVRSRRALMWVDALILGTAVGLVLAGLAIRHTPSDEGTLVGQAARSLLNGQPIYGVPWPDLFSQTHVAITKMMDGGADYTFGYPPLAVFLTAPAVLFMNFQTADSVVTVLALVAGAITLWWLLPVAWRSGATAVMLGFAFLPHYARLGYPAVIAMALLIPVVVRWPAIGSGGHLRRADVLKAVCLGAACATQQLAWFLAPFLIVGLYALRRGEVPPRRALRTVGAFAGVAAGIFGLINLPFIVRDAPAWAAGVLLVLTQHAIPHGQGIIDVSFYLTDGSGALDYYGYATLLLGAGMLVVSAVWLRRLGPALTVIPWLVFYLSVRSQDGYFLLMTPLWLAAAATAPPSAFQGAWQPRLRSVIPARFPRLRNERRLLGTPARLALAVVLVAPALLSASVAVTSDEPLELDVIGTASHGSHDQGLWQVDVQVENEDAVALAPHFAVSLGQGITAFWNATGGPATLAPEQTATYVLTATVPAGYTPGTRGYLYLRALTDAPETVSTVKVPVQ